MVISKTYLDKVVVLSLVSRRWEESVCMCTSWRLMCAKNKP